MSVAELTRSSARWRFAPLSFLPRSCGRRSNGVGQQQLQYLLTGPPPLKIFEAIGSDMRKVSIGHCLLLTSTQCESQHEP